MHWIRVYKVKLKQTQKNLGRWRENRVKNSRSRGFMQVIGTKEFRSERRSFRRRRTKLFPSFHFFASTLETMLDFYVKTNQQRNINHRHYKQVCKWGFLLFLGNKQSEERRSEENRSLKRRDTWKGCRLER